MKTSTLLSLAALTCSSAFAAAVHAPANLPRSTTTTTNITWGGCGNPTGDTTIQCGNLTVPLDYLNSSSPTLQLQLIKKPAATQPAPKGSILLNFGGPGGDGFSNFVALVPTLMGPIIGDQHDIISWDPRGTRNTLPWICYDDPSLATYLTGWYDADSAAPGRLWSEGGALSTLCYDRLREWGRFVGMASAARDMMAIVDALGEDDGLLQYWGISGGTAMGATVAAMFPDRMKRVVLDGVMNSHSYYHAPVEYDSFDSSDSVLVGLLDACVRVGAAKCPLATFGNSTAELESAVYAFLNNLKTNAITVPIVESGTALQIGYSDVMNVLFPMLYSPVSYPIVASTLAALMAGEYLTAVTLAFGNVTTTTTTTNSTASTTISPTAVWAIRCGDKKTDAKSLKGLQPGIKEAAKRSKFFGAFGLGPNALLCAQWKFEAAERYNGSFDVATKNPILLIGNSYDPITPLSNARNMTASFKNATLLHHDGYGHTSFFQGTESSCTKAVIRKYLDDGVLPKGGTVCKSDSSLEDIMSGKYNATA